jgi:hypothetical protein
MLQQPVTAIGRHIDLVVWPFDESELFIAAASAMPSTTRQVAVLLSVDTSQQQMCALFHARTCSVE